MANRTKMFCPIILSGSNVITGTLHDEGDDPYNFEITSGSFFLCFSGTVEGRTYESLTTKLGDVLTETSPLGYTYTAKYDAILDRVVITGQEHNSQITASNAFSQGVLGFTDEATDIDLGYQITGSFQPSHLWISTYVNPAEFHPSQDQQTFKDSVADSGRVFSIGRFASPLTNKFKFPMEPPENAFTDQKDYGWAWDTFVRSTGPTWPVMMITGNCPATTAQALDNQHITMAFKHRAESGFFKFQATNPNSSLFYNFDLDVWEITKP